MSQRKKKQVGNSRAKFEQRESRLKGCPWLLQIRIKGPVLCRKGVLMLTAGNVQLLGGEVDDLKQSNSKEALLCRALNRPVSDECVLRSCWVTCR